MPKHASNDSVAERRLRPIYDWLDNGNNKRALQEADKLMRKHPEFECCQALRCLALMRLGREGEATQVRHTVQLALYFRGLLSNRGHLAKMPSKCPLKP